MSDLPVPTLQERAVDLGNTVLSRGLARVEGGVSWRGPTGYGTELNPLRISQLGPHLYHGILGIAVFLAALARASGQEHFRSVSLKTIASLRSQLRQRVASPTDARRSTLPVGGLIGVGSLVYGLLLIGDFLKERALVEEAHDTASLLTPEVIGGDPQFRIQTGAAGALLSLLALHHCKPSATVNGLTPLELARVCAEHLREHRVQIGEGVNAWPLSAGKPPVTGFSYGAAGIAYALLRLHEVTGEARWRELARQGWSFVRSHYAVEHGNWRDARAVFESKCRPTRGTWRDWWASGSLDDLEPSAESESSGDRFLEIWCHGAAGIAMARLATLATEDSPEIRQEIETTVARLEADARSETLGPLADDLCCGHAGIVELLVDASRILRRRSALDAARALVEKIWLRAESTGGFQLSAARGRDVFAPTLFQGMSGLGYTLLRLARPSDFPCLLRLEAPGKVEAGCQTTSGCNIKHLKLDQESTAPLVVARR